MDKETRTIYLVIAALIVIFFLLYFFWYPSHQSISTFEECAAAGYPIMQSYPRQCTYEGTTFVEEAVTEDRTYCSAESRNAEVCIQIYEPVCGWSDPARIQCIKYPCAQTYGNSCNACANNDVLYWTAGECPSG